MESNFSFSKEAVPGWTLVEARKLLRNLLKLILE